MSDDSSEDVARTDAANRSDGLDLLWKMFVDANAWIERAHKTWQSLLIPYCIIIIFAEEATKIAGVGVEKIYAVIFFGTGILFSMLAVMWHVQQAISLQAVLATRNAELAEFPQIAEKVRDHYSKFSYTNPLKETFLTHKILLFNCLITLLASILYYLLFDYQLLLSAGPFDSILKFLTEFVLDWQSVSISLLILFFLLSSWGIWEVLLNGFVNIGFQTKNNTIEHFNLLRSIEKKRLIVILIPIILILVGQGVMGFIAFR